MMSAICEGRFNPDAPRSQYWPTAMPVCRTPRPADFQGPGVVPMTPKVNIEHEILGQQPEESTAGPELAESNVIDISSSSESESSVSEMSLSSDEEGPPLQEPSPKIARWQAKLRVMRSGFSTRRRR